MSIDIILIEDKKYKGMYRLLWEDKVISEDMYNLTRASEHRHVLLGLKPRLVRRTLKERYKR